MRQRNEGRGISIANEGYPETTDERAERVAFATTLVDLTDAGVDVQTGNF